MDKLEYMTLRTLVHQNTIRELKNSLADWERPASQLQRPVSALCTEYTRGFSNHYKPLECHATPCSRGEVRQVLALSGSSEVRALVPREQTVLPEVKGLGRARREEPGDRRMGAQGPANSALRPDPGVSPAACLISAAGGHLHTQQQS